MKRVLVISYYWPPSGGSGVQRWVKMCKYLPSYGWQSVVYTPENPAVTSTDSTLAAEIPDSVEVVRRRIVEPGQFARRSTSAQVTPINAQKKTFRQRIAMWIRGNCFIPDPRVVWVRGSVRFLLKYLKEHPVDAIVSTGPPHSMHLIARSLSRRTGLPWVADFRDPWTKMFYFKHLSLSKAARCLHERLEKSVLDGATRVVAVSPLVQEDFRTMTSTKVELITNGFDTTDFPRQSAEQPPRQAGKQSVPQPAEQSAEQSLRQAVEAAVPGSEAPFTIVHAGLFASDGNPECLWKALAGLVQRDEQFASRLRIVLCGKTDRAVLDSIAAAGLAGCCTDHGYVDHTHAVRLMRGASVLMLPLRKEPEYRATLPGKLFEYLASRRPVLGIGQKDGAMAAVLSATGAGKTFGWEDRDAVEAFLADAFVKWRCGSLADNPADLTAYTRDGLAARYAAILDEITQTNE